MTKAWDLSIGYSGDCSEHVTRESCVTGSMFREVCSVNWSCCGNGSRDCFVSLRNEAGGVGCFSG